MKKMKWFGMTWFLLLASVAGGAQQADMATTREAGVPEFVWKQSLPIPWGDPGIYPIGGTELRALVVFDNKLFASNDYWMDTEKANPDLPGAQVLRLDGPDSKWQVDLELKDRMPSGLRKYLGIAAMEKVRFTTDGAGQPLGEPVDLLLAGVWNRAADGIDVFSRGIGGNWTKIPIPGQENAPRGAQVRAFAVHRDSATGVDIVFAGATHGIFTGTFDRASGTVVWNPRAEWTGEPGGFVAGGRARVASFANCGGKLYATSGGAIYEREDGTSPTWKKIFETAIHSNNANDTGLRGLTCIADPAGSGPVLLVGLENNPCEIFRIDPHKTDAAGGNKATLELDVSAFLTKALGTRAGYGIVAYNNMTEYPDASKRFPSLLMGFEVFTPRASRTFGAKFLNPDAHYLVRDSDGNYTLREIQDLGITPKPQLESVRTIAVSPFASDPPGTLYAGGFDCNSYPVHNTAWLYRGEPSPPIPKP